MTALVSTHRTHSICCTSEPMDRQSRVTILCTLHKKKSFYYQDLCSNIDNPAPLGIYSYQYFIQSLFLKIHFFVAN